MTLLSLGAINKLTGEYVYPKIANKKYKYICTDCNKDLVLCSGEVINNYFRHKADDINKCCHYNCHYNEDRTECKIMLNLGENSATLYQDCFFLHYNVVDSIFSIR